MSLFPKKVEYPFKRNHGFKFTHVTELFMIFKDILIWAVKIYVK